MSTLARVTIGRWELALHRRDERPLAPAPLEWLLEAPVAGVVDAIYVRMGDVVVKGQVVCQIDGTEVESKVAGRVLACLAPPGLAIQYGHPLLRLLEEA